jgi:cell wall-associated NlpC family hydrolase
MKLRIAIAVIVAAPLLVAPAKAASIQDVKDRVTRLRDEATAAAEGAQTAKVQLANLNRQLNGIQQEADARGRSVAALRKSLGAIAVAKYKDGALGQDIQLLFSSDPKKYLEAAGTLEQITHQQAIALRKYSAAQQKLTATTFTVNDRLTIVARTKARLDRQNKIAQSKLAEAEALLASLKAAERERLAKLSAEEEAAELAQSRRDAKGAAGISGRAGIALRYALKQIGDRYVFGAAGMVTWDCSGLTMRAYQAAGVSLPHSAAMQMRYGKKVDRKDLRAGDLVFFGRPVSHVGIYLGGGKMVDAPRSGARVRVESFGNSFGYKPYMGARRF